MTDDKENAAASNTPRGVGRPAFESCMRTEQDRILQGSQFHSSPTLVRLLKWLVDETLAGRGDLIKSYTIAVVGGGAGVASKTGPAPPVVIRPGTRLIREWNGKTIAVTAAEQGFEYEGKQFSSLTQIASEVTGTHWSGPRFFGMTKRSSARG